MSLIDFWNKLWKRDDARDNFWKDRFDNAGTMPEEMPNVSFCVADKGAINPDQDIACWINSGGIGWRIQGAYKVNEEPVTKEAFDMWMTDSRITDLRASIETARRNKKKSSHLVAELAELENGK